MRGTTLLTTFVALLALGHPRHADAQPRWRLELAPGAALMTDDLPGSDVGLGFGAEGSLMFRIQPQLGAYAGWNWHRFLGEAPNDERDLEEIGYAFGMRFEHPLGVIGSPAIMIRVGGTWNRLEFENAVDTLDSTSKGLGWEIGGGIAFPMNGRWTLTPAVRYRATNHDVRVGDALVPASLGYALAELGMALNF